MSIIVADTNTGARRLYQRAGYSEVTPAVYRREIWQTDTENWVLLIKPLSSCASATLQRLLKDRETRAGS
ncbi:MAG: hypothetical protein AAGF94_07225 [Pseudomonadota bacterium]